MRLDRLEIELGKMADTCGSFYMLDFATDVGEESEKDEGDDDSEEDIVDNLPGPLGLGSVSEDSSEILGGPMDLIYSLLSFSLSLY